MAVPVISYCIKNHLYKTSTGTVVYWIKHLTKDPEVDGSNLTGVKFCDFLKKVLSSNTSNMEILIGHIWI